MESRRRRSRSQLLKWGCYVLALFVCAALQTTPPAGRKTYIIKDVRLFLNSVDRGLHLMRQAGVDAGWNRQDTDREILLTIRIPKRASGKIDSVSESC